MPLDPASYLAAAYATAASTFAVDAAEDTLSSDRAINGRDIDDKFAMHQLYLQNAQQRQQQMSQLHSADPNKSRNYNNLAQSVSQIAGEQAPVNSIVQFQRGKNFRESQRNKGVNLAKS